MHPSLINGNGIVIKESNFFIITIDERLWSLLLDERLYYGNLGMELITIDERQVGKELLPTAPKSY